MKRALSFVIILAMVFSLAVPAFANESAEAASATTVRVVPHFLSELAAQNLEIFIHAGMMGTGSTEAALTAAATRIAPNSQGVFNLEPGWYTMFHRGADPATREEWHRVHTFFQVPAELLGEDMPLLIENSPRAAAFEGITAGTTHSNIRRQGEQHGTNIPGVIIRQHAIENMFTPQGTWSVAPAQRDAEGNRLPGQTWALGSDLVPFEANGFHSPMMRNMIFDETGMLIGVRDPNRSIFGYTTREEMFAFMAELNTGHMNSDMMHIFNAGFSPHSWADMAIDELRNDFVVFTASDISEAADWNEVGEIVRNNGKPTFFLYTAVHGHEKPATEGALNLMHSLVTTEWGAATLQDINIVLYPEVNGTGNHQMTRRTAVAPEYRTAEGRPAQHHQDPNRDFVAQFTQEIAQLHQVWLAFMPEVTVDGHEIGTARYNAQGWIEAGAMADDTQIQLAATHEVDDRIVALGARMLQRGFDDGKEAGVRVGYYNVLIVNASVGNYFYGLFGGISYILETRGQGPEGKMRRAFATYAQMRSMIEYMRETADEIHSTVAAVRADLIAAGSRYTPGNQALMVDQQGGSVTAAHIASYADHRMPAINRWATHWQGGYRLVTANHMIPTTRALVTRDAPTGYIVPLEIDWDTTSPNALGPWSYDVALERLFYLLETHGIEHFIIEPGVTVPVQQFHVSSTVVSTRHNNFTAGTRETEYKTFDVPVLLIPMDQVQFHVIANLMEPEMRVAMREGATVSLSWVQSLDGSPLTATGTPNTPNQGGTTALGQITHIHDPATMNFPIYRVVTDNPRRFVEDVWMSTDAHLVDAGQYFTIETEFSRERETNAIDMTYTFDGELFAFANFTPAEGVSVLHTEHGEGYVRLVLMAPNYDVQEIGSVMLRALADAEFDSRWASVALSVDFVERDAEGVKTIQTAAAAVHFTTVGDWGGPGTGPQGPFTLIDLSNIIDIFGTNNTHPNWNTHYTFWDFNNNGSIDIYDIVWVAQRVITSAPVAPEAPEAEEEDDEEEAA